jgi:hypothetical protein
MNATESGRFDMKLLNRRGQVDIVKLLLVLLILVFFGLLPVWPYAHSWGYWPGGFVGLLLLIVLLRVLGVI